MKEFLNPNSHIKVEWGVGSVGRPVEKPKGEETVETDSRFTSTKEPSLDA